VGTGVFGVIHELEGLGRRSRVSGRRVATGSGLELEDFSTRLPEQEPAATVDSNPRLCEGKS
jgi:hypothetical protein